MIRRPPRSTRVRSSAASDVYKRQSDPCRVKKNTRRGIRDEMSNKRRRVEGASTTACIAKPRTTLYWNMCAADALVPSNQACDHGKEVNGKKSHSSLGRTLDLMAPARRQHTHSNTKLPSVSPYAEQFADNLCLWFGKFKQPANKHHEYHPLVQQESTRVNQECQL